MNSDEDYSKKAARRQRVTFILVGLLGAQVFTMIILFLTGVFEENKNLFRIVALAELIAFGFVYFVLNRSDR